VLNIPSDSLARRHRFEWWPKVLRSSVRDHLDRPFIWGESDCAFFRQIVIDMTGFDCAEDVEGYNSEDTARAVLRAAGFASVIDLVAARFPEIHPSEAMRGDLGYVDGHHDLMSPLIIMGSEAVTKASSGQVVISRAQITRAFAV